MALKLEDWRAALIANNEALAKRVGEQLSRHEAQGDQLDQVIVAQAKVALGAFDALNQMIRETQPRKSYVKPALDKA